MWREGYKTKQVIQTAHWAASLPLYLLSRLLQSILLSTIISLFYVLTQHGSRMLNNKSVSRNWSLLCHYLHYNKEITKFCLCMLQLKMFKLIVTYIVVNWRCTCSWYRRQCTYIHFGVIEGIHWLMLFEWVT